MNLEKEKELNERIVRLADIAKEAMNERDVLDVKLWKSEATVKRYKFHMKVLATMIVCMLVSYVAVIVFLIPDPVVCEGEEKAWDKYLVELNACWGEQEFLAYAHDFGFCDPRPMEMFTRSCEAAWEINRDQDKWLTDCELNLMKCRGQIPAEVEP
jgi:hypothetical protein